MDHNIAEINDVRCFRRFERDIAADHIGEPADAPRAVDGSVTESSLNLYLTSGLDPLIMKRCADWWLCCLLRCARSASRWRSHR